MRLGSSNVSLASSPGLSTSGAAGGGGLPHESKVEHSLQELKFGDFDPVTPTSLNRSSTYYGILHGSDLQATADSKVPMEPAFPPSNLFGSASVAPNAFDTFVSSAKNISTNARATNQPFRSTAASSIFADQERYRFNLIPPSDREIVQLPIGAGSGGFASATTSNHAAINSGGVSVEVHMPAMHLKQPTPRTVTNLKEICSLLQEYRALKIHSSSEVKLSMFLSIETSNHLASLAVTHLGVSLAHIIMGGILLCDNYTIEQLLALMVKPISSADFIFKLCSALTFPKLPSGYKLSMDNFGPLYNALLDYRRIFEEANHLLLRCLTRTECEVILPLMTYRKSPKSYPYIFLEPIPFNFGECLLAGVAHLTLKSFGTIEAFINYIYSEVVREFFLSSKKTEFGNQLLSTAAASKPDTTTTVTSTAVTSRTGTYSSASRPLLLRRPSNYQQRSASQSVHMADQSTVDTDFVPDDEEMDQLVFDDALQELSSSSAAGSAQLSANLPCFEKMRTGKCSNSACQYRHDDSSLGKAIAIQLNRFQSYPLFSKLGFRIVFPPGVHPGGSSQPSGRTASISCALEAVADPTSASASS